MDRREVEVKISGLNINTPDSLVVEYISKHGRVVHPKVIYDTEKEGPLKGLKMTCDTLRILLVGVI